jgi:UDP-N-acetylmuramoylalanine--D-glutamate ligase
MTTRTYFQGKRIAVIGLGSQGEMVSDVQFLIKANALVSLYDLRSEARLKNYLTPLRSIGLATYICGSIPADDLFDMDLIILSHEYPRDSSFLKGAREKGIQIEYPETLFFRLAPPVTVIGIMGSCGKATVASILAPFLDIACETEGTQRMFYLDPESDQGIVSALKKIKSGDIALIRITAPMMHELYTMRVSPHVAIFTTVPPPGSYTDSPFEILTYQTYNNFIVANDVVIDAIHTFKFQPKAKMLRTKSSFLIPSSWSLGTKVTGGWSHDRDNAALAVQVAHLFKVPHEICQSFLEKWKPLHGRLEFIKKIKNIEFYNDTASISSGSTVVAIQSLAKDKNLILIFGGALGVDRYQELYVALPRYIHTLILLPGSGTMRERVALGALEGVIILSAASVEVAVSMARDHARPGDRVVFSPGFPAGGIDASRAERGESFVRAVRGL